MGFLIAASLKSRGYVRNNQAILRDGGFIVANTVRAFGNLQFFTHSQGPHLGLTSSYSLLACSFR